jgi:ABC-type multidrug transport system permease subunit
MKTLRVLLIKDLRRAWRNPVGWLVFLAIPLVITALIGMVFGPKSSDNALGRIKFALVDEDDSVLTRMLRGAISQGKGAEHLDTVYLGRGEALRQLQNDQLSAVVVIPAGFTRAYLGATNIASLELVKNPAQSIYPAVLEELLGAVVTALDALKRNLASELSDWQAVLEGGGDYHRVSALMVRAGDKLKAARKSLFPPLITYANETESSNPAGSAQAAAPGEGKTPEQKPGGAGGAARKEPGFNIFGYLLPGLVSMFLLFLGENASRDIHREMEQRTLQRFRSLHHQLYDFVASKVVFCLVFLMLGSAVMLGGGGLLFRIDWRNPLALFLLTASYCMFASGLMTLLPALLGDHRSSQALANVVAMLLGMVGGATIPARQLPAFLRDHVSPLLPNYWYTEAVRSVAFDSHPGGWLSVVLKLALVGAALMALAAWLLRRGLERGTRG